jgi:hypothetical protein
MGKTIFYAWQAQRPPRANRSLIQSALERAIEALQNEEPDLELEQDARGTVGASEISATILGKIEACSVFVADVTPVGVLANDRPTPNPNVMFELGFAWRELTEARVILVLNERFGSPEDLPFDISKRCLVRYHFDPESGEFPAPARNLLTSQFRELLGSMLKDEHLERLREDGLQEVDIRLFQAVFAAMILGNDDVVDYDVVVAKGSEIGLNSKEVDDSTQVIDQAGLWNASPVIGSRRYSHLKATTTGMERYCVAFLPAYVDLRNRAASLLVDEKMRSSRTLAAELQQPDVVVEHILQILENNEYIRTSSDSGGVYIFELLPKLRRQLAQPE